MEKILGLLAQWGNQLYTVVDDPLLFTLAGTTAQTGCTINTFQCLWGVSVSEDA